MTIFRFAAALLKKSIKNKEYINIKDNNNRASLGFTKTIHYCY
jgi:hypothetical protein